MAPAAPFARDASFTTGVSGQHGRHGPRRQGLYDPANEHDACGVGMVADLNGRVSHDIIEKALTVLRNLDHRGAKGAEPTDGDGAGILTQLPDSFFREVTDFALPAPGAYAAGIAFLPADEVRRAKAIEIIERIAAEEGLSVLGWRELPHEPRFCGPAAHRVMPHLAQLFLAADPAGSFPRRRRSDHYPMAFCP